MKKTIFTKLCITLLFVFTLFFTISFVSKGAVVKKTIYVNIGSTSSIRNSSTINEDGLYGYKYLDEGTYPDLLAKVLTGANKRSYTSRKVYVYNGADYRVELYQLGMDYMRTADFNYLLSENDNLDSYGTYLLNNNKWLRTAGEYELGDEVKDDEVNDAIAELKLAYSEAIIDADVITINVGYNDFVTYISELLNGTELTDNFFDTFDDETLSRYNTIMSYINKLLENELYKDNIAPLLPEVGGLKKLINAVTYSVLNFINSYEELITNITSLNSDAKIIIVPTSLDLKEEEIVLDGYTLPLSKLYQGLLAFSDLYQATLSSYSDNYLFAITESLINGKALTNEEIAASISICLDEDKTIKDKIYKQVRDYIETIREYVLNNGEELIDELGVKYLGDNYYSYKELIISKFNEYLPSFTYENLTHYYELALDDFKRYINANEYYQRLINLNNPHPFMSEEFNYVVIGTNTTYASTLSRKDTPYYDTVYEKSGFKKSKSDSPDVISSDEIMPWEFIKYIQDNEEALKEANFITYQFDFGTVIKSLLSSGEEWTEYLDQKTIDTIDRLYLYMQENAGLDDSLMELVSGFGKNFIYGFSTFVINYFKGISELKKINPNATICVVGIFNPLQGLKISSDGELLEVDTYLDDFVSYFNLVTKYFTVLYKDVVYVDVSEVEITGFKTINVGDDIVKSLLSTLTNLDYMFPNASGHDYIASQIIEKIPVSYHVHSFGEFEKFDSTNHVKYCECGKAIFEEHSFDKGVITKEATHLEEGLITYTCSVCGETKTEKIDKIKEHSYGVPTYVWNASSCTATCKCACGDVVTETITGVYVKDTDASCTSNELGHLEATFTNALFTKQSTAKDSYEVPNSKGEHSYGTPTYKWDGNSCTATKVCSCGDTVTETATGVYVKDTNASCIANETGHLEATFIDSSFTKQSTAKDSEELENTMTGHSYDTITYSWSGNSSTATKTCVCGHSLSETIDGVYVKDTDATCTQNEKGHLEATFKDSAYEKQSTAKDSVEKENTKLPHTYGEVTYTWDGNSCTASKSCSCGDTISETVPGVYVKDTDATCTHNETGHLIATFEKTGFVSQSTAKDSFEVENSKLPHSYSKPTYTWIGNVCTAVMYCSCGDTVSEVVTGVYVKDSDATCKVNEKGHYTATFKNSAFEVQSTATFEKENTKVDHTYKEATYSWVNDSCIGSRVCLVCGYTNSLFIEGVYVKDTDATCTHNESGHLHAEFNSEGFTSQDTLKDSYVIKDSILPHTYGEAVYTWEGNKCVAVRTCSCGYQRGTEVVGVYVKDTDATCTHNETGHFYAVFEEDGFVSQSTDADSYEVLNTMLPHTYGEATYTWDDNSCTASKSCSCGDTISETVTGVYVKDTDETCTEKEKGHYVAIFTTEGFETQETEKDSISLPESDPHHTYNKKGICEVCGEKDPNYVKPKLSAFAITAIVVGGCGVLVGGYFILKKVFPFI